MARLYILKNTQDRHYVGITETEVLERLERHNKGYVKSTKFYKPWSVIYTEYFSSMSGARRREKQIKSWKGGSAFKKLISV